MRMSRSFRFGGIAVGLALVALGVGGCLDAREGILGRYDADKDQFVFLNIYQRIGGQNPQDYDYLEKLWNNRDHLITPPMPGFVSKVCFLRVSDTEFAAIDLRQGKPHAVSPTSLPLNQVTVKPGRFFVRGGDALCYYDQIVVPGSFADATVKLVNGLGSEGMKAAINAERDRRKNGGTVVRWAALDKAVRDNIRNMNASAQANPNAGAKDAPAPDATSTGTDPLAALSEASLARLEKGFDGVWLVRDRAVFRATFPLEESDAKGFLAFIATQRDAIGEELKRPGHDPLLEKAALPLSAIEARSPRRGAVELSVDASKLFERMEAAADPTAALPAQSDDDAARSRDTLAAIKAKKIPIDGKTTVEQIVADFHAKKLKGFPPEKSVPPGEGIVERK
ncbi:MAG: hypothetical protein JWP03_4633 [Phycisphaerales bacterium]|nr:hypothetical protein [Phycisphaerales bacterium]